MNDWNGFARKSREGEPMTTPAPEAVAALLAAGHPGAALAYYRGGLHDWQTLGLPVEACSAESEARMPAS